MKDSIKNTLVFDIKELQYEDFKAYNAQVPPSSLGLDYEDAAFIEPLSCTLHLLRQGDSTVCLTANIQTKIALECRRCIETFEINLTTTIELFFALGNPSPEQNQTDTRYYDGETIDLSEDVRQALVLEIPIWPLCTQTCKGLCIHCGTQLNTAACTCATTDEITAPTSNPFADLSKMLENR